MVPGEGGRAREAARMLEPGAGPTALGGGLESAGWWFSARNAGSDGRGPDDAAETLPAYEDADIALYRVGGASPVAPQGKRCGDPRASGPGGDGAGRRGRAGPGPATPGPPS